MLCCFAQVLVDARGPNGAAVRAAARPVVRRVQIQLNLRVILQVAVLLLLLYQVWIPWIANVLSQLGIYSSTCASSYKSRAAPAAVPGTMLACWALLLNRQNAIEAVRAFQSIPLCPQILSKEVIVLTAALPARALPAAGRWRRAAVPLRFLPPAHLAAAPGRPRAGPKP